MKAWIGTASRLATGAGLGGFLIRALAGSGAIRLVAMAASFLVGVQLARGLGPSGYGYYGVALSVITLCGIPGEMGLPRLVTREVAAAMVRDDLPHLFGVLRWANRWAIHISLMIGLGLAAAALVIARSAPSPLVWALVAGAPVVPFMALSRVRGGALQGLQHIVRGQIPPNLLRPLAQSILLFVVWVAGASLTPASAMGINSIASGGAFLLASYWLATRLPGPAPAEIVRGGRDWLASTIPMAAADGMRILQSELTILLVGFLTTASEVGLFRVAVATTFAAATPTAIINQVAFPTIARLYANGEMERLQKAVTRLSQAQFVGVSVLCLPLIVAPGFLMELVFGAEYVGAATAVRILAIAQVLNAALGPTFALLNMTHQERRVTRAMATGLIANVCTAAFLTPLWGSTGAALGIFVGLLSWTVQTWLDARRAVGIDCFVFPITIRAR